MTGSFGAYLLTAFALMLVIEGLIYALFPDAVKRMMALALSLPPQNLRFFGFTVALAGVFVLWLLRMFFDS